MNWWLGRVALQWDEQRPPEEEGEQAGRGVAACDGFGVFFSIVDVVFCRLEADPAQTAACARAEQCCPAP